MHLLVPGFGNPWKHQLGAGCASAHGRRLRGTHCGMPDPGPKPGHVSSPGPFCPEKSGKCGIHRFCQPIRFPCRGVCLCPPAGVWRLSSGDFHEKGGFQPDSPDLCVFRLDPEPANPIGRQLFPAPKPGRVSGEPKAGSSDPSFVGALSGFEPAAPGEIPPVRCPLERRGFSPVPAHLFSGKRISFLLYPEWAASRSPLRFLQRPPLLAYPLALPCLRPGDLLRRLEVFFHPAGS